MSTGNDYFFTDKIVGSDNILFIANASTYNELANVAVETSRLTAKKVYFKIHPEQYSEFKKIKNKIESISNVIVLGNGYSTSDLLLKCTHVVGVRSSFMYSASQAGKNIYLYKYKNYDWDKILLSKANIFFTPRELVDLVENRRNISNNIDIYFAKFNYQAFIDIINCNIH